MLKPSPLSAAERSLHAQLAAHESWANTPDRSARTRAAREAFNDKFLREADGDPIRAEHKRKAFYARLAMQSAQARRKSREYTHIAEAADALAEVGGGERDAS